MSAIPSARPPIVVIGAGVAGLSTALAAAPARVLMLCRDIDGAGSASALAQGGIAAALADGDSAEAHACDTLAAGAHHNRRELVEWLCRQAPDAVRWLRTQGVAFDRDAAGRLSLGREGGHGASRIVHAGGDATGAALIRVLLERARQADHIQWRGGFEASALAQSEGRVCGVRATDAVGNVHEFDASAVVLATGGIGALFARTSNPAGADGAGLALALAAGARPRHLEFIQFHPTALDIAGQHLPLLTEALRGAGAVLRDDTGQALMAAHPLRDLAPRDVVSRGVWQARRNGPVWLDACGVENLAARFPTVLAACLAHGLDPRRDPLPVTPVVHFHMGGVATDADGATSLAGLHAVGEVACNGIHGANRLASNSLLEAVACGRRLGERLSLQTPVTVPRSKAQWHCLGEPLPGPQLKQLREWLWQGLGPIRDHEGMTRARTQCELWGEAWQARLARALIQAGLRRRLSLGAHYRSDEDSQCRPTARST